MRKKIKLIIAYGIYFVTIVLLLIALIPQLKDNLLFHIYAIKQNILFNKIPLNNMDNIIETKKLDENQKYIILTFDDGWSSQYDAYQMLKPFKGTLYICPSLIGKEDRLTLRQLGEMYNNGWDISNHTFHHTNLLEIDSKKAVEEIYRCSEWIKDLGFTRNQGYLHFAYPEGAFNDEIIEILKEQNILTARTTAAGSDTTDDLKLGRMSLHGMTPQNIKDNILSDKQLLILSFHRIIPDDSAEVKEIDIKESYFQQVIDSIYESKREVITITEWYGMRECIY